MKVVWDETKRLANLDKHGLDFADCEGSFDFARAIEAPACPSHTGCQRRTLVGELDGEIVVVAVVSPLGSEALSLISLRPASDKERRAYGA
ncbi:MAG TPA: BrnT family toxin [Lichenihabitans sp.]|jgi:hypothetical protein|nr:BrnT family toxin [Lichenihabitans sp.]